MDASRARVSQRYRRLAAIFVAFAFLVGALNLPACSSSAHGAPAGLAFTNGQLVKDSVDTNIYFYWDGELHPVLNPQAWFALGYLDPNAVMIVAQNLAASPQGSTLGLDTVGNGLPFPLSPIANPNITLTFGQASVVAGQSVQLTGAGLHPGESIGLILPWLPYPYPLAADMHGGFSTALAVPASWAPGPARIFVIGQSNDFGLEIVHVVSSATAQVTASPSPVQPNAYVDISGSGFQGGEQVNVFLSRLMAMQVTASSTGSFGPLHELLSPSTPLGDYTVLAQGQSSGQYASQPLSIGLQAATPSPTAVPMALTLTPGTVVVGGQVSVAGAGFAPGEQIVVKLGDSPGATTLVGPDGSFSGYVFTVATSMSPGTYALTVTGQSSGRVASAALTLQAAQAGITISPATAAPGGRVVVAGSGFVGGETISVAVKGAIVQHAVVSASGSFDGVAFAVPAGLAPGDYVVSVQGTSGRTATATLTVAQAPVAQLTLNPGTVVAGGSVEVSGLGFEPKEQVLIRVDTVLQATVICDASGGFSTHLGPEVKVGDHGIMALGTQSELSAAATLHVVAPRPATVRLASSKLHPGDAVIVSGGGFQPGEIVLIRFNGAVVENSVAGNNGSFTKATFHLSRKLKAGRYALKVTGARTGRAASTTVQVSLVPVSAIVVKPVTVHAGQSIAIMGTAFGANEIVVISVHGAVLAAANSDAHGAFKATFTVPATAAHGATTVEAAGMRSKAHARAALMIQ